MLVKKTFIKADHRPDLASSHIDNSHITELPLSNDASYENIRTDTSINTICFGPRNDKVLMNIEHLMKEDQRLLILYYEDMFKRWTFTCRSGDVNFIVRKSNRESAMLKPTCIYIRGAITKSNDVMSQQLAHFHQLLMLWPYKLICGPNVAYNNESKLFQLNSSLKKASHSLESISIGKSYVVKGVNQYLNLPKDKSFIVKSLSAVRSKVVDDRTYKNWSFKSLDHLPTLFQEKAEGLDIRVHILYGKTFAKMSTHKSNTDYRYQDKFELCDVEPSEDLKTFCKLVAQDEHNEFMGLDFIKTEHGFQVLEANPCPGWSAYHPFNSASIDPFLVALKEVLTSD